MQRLTVKKITPVLFAQEVEPCVKFWVERLGFTKIVEVPEGDKLGFAMLQKAEVELMYQTFASADKDVPAVAHFVRQGPTFLYVEVENLEEFMGAVQGAEVVVPVRTTFYGAKEIGIRDPAGHFVTFAQMGAPTAELK
ncbi:MAG TPA: VOC family protein [Terriglobia bacterium]|nr:VOC family protein [Terriglobia bacterium]